MSRKSRRKSAWKSGVNREGLVLPEGKLMSGLLMDLDELLARVENDRELMRDLMLVFKEEFPRHSEALREAVASQDASGVVSAAHTLKGMLSNMAAGEAAAAAASLERLGRN